MTQITIVVNDESGAIVEVNKSGIDETFNYNNFTVNSKKLKKLKLATILNVADIIKRARVIGDDITNYKKDTSKIKYMHLIGSDIVDGESVSVKITVRKSPQKNKFWVHNIMIEKTAESIPAGTSSSSKTGYLTFNGNESLSQTEDNVKYSLKLSDTDSMGNELSKEQREFFKDSKVLDEDGNLLVVYHGTDSDFTVFDKTKGRATMDIQGMFFSPWEIDAKGYGGNVSAYYLNISIALENDDTQTARSITNEILKIKYQENLKKGKTSKAALSDAKAAVKNSLRAKWKDKYKEADYLERVRIRNLLWSTGAYSNMRQLNDTLNGWLREK